MLHLVKALGACQTSMKQEANEEMNRAFSMIILKILLITVKCMRRLLALLLHYNLRAIFVRSLSAKGVTI